jgi:hypothetical protein
VYGKTIKISPLRVAKDWYKGLDDEKVDISMSLHEKPKPAENGT